MSFMTRIPFYVELEPHHKRGSSQINPYQFTAVSQGTSTTIDTAVTFTLQRTGVPDPNVGWDIVGTVIGETVEFIEGSETSNTIDVVFILAEGFVGTGSFQFIPFRTNSPLLFRYYL